MNGHLATNMAAKSQSKVISKNNKNAAPSNAGSVNAKGDQKTKKKVTLEGDEEVEEKDGTLAYKILSADQCKELLTVDVEAMQGSLCDIFKLGNYSTDLKEAAVLDYYTGAVWWAKEQEFNPEQLSGFFTVVHMLLDNVKENHMSLCDNMKELKKLFIGIDPEHPDIRSSGLDFFNSTQAKAMLQYITSCLLQHYKLYELMFTQTQAEEIIGTDLEIEVAKPADLPFPPPLDEGVSQEMFDSYIATPPPTPPPEEPKEEGIPDDLDEKLDTDIFSELTPDDVREVIESVAKQLLDPLQSEVAAKLKEKESLLIGRINKIHIVAEDVTN